MLENVAYSTLNQQKNEKFALVFMVINAIDRNRNYYVTPSIPLKQKE